MSKQLNKLLNQSACINDSETIKNVVEDLMKVDVGQLLALNVPPQMLQFTRRSLCNGFHLREDDEIRFGDLIGLLFGAPFVEYFKSGDVFCADVEIRDYLYPSSISACLMRFLLLAEKNIQVKRFMSIGLNRFMLDASKLSLNGNELRHERYKLRNSIMREAKFEELFNGKIDNSFTIKDAFTILQYQVNKMYMPGLHMLGRYEREMNQAVMNVYFLLVTCVYRFIGRNPDYQITSINKRFFEGLGSSSFEDLFPDFKDNKTTE